MAVHRIIDAAVTYTGGAKQLLKDEDVISHGRNIDRDNNSSAFKQVTFAMAPTISYLGQDSRLEGDNNATDFNDATDLMERQPQQQSVLVSTSPMVITIERASNGDKKQQKRVFLQNQPSHSPTSMASSSAIGSNNYHQYKQQQGYSGTSSNVGDLTAIDETTSLASANLQLIKSSTITTKREEENANLRKFSSNQKFRSSSSAVSAPIETSNSKYSTTMTAAEFIANNSRRTLLANSNSLDNNANNAAQHYISKPIAKSEVDVDYGYLTHDDSLKAGHNIDYSVSAQKNGSKGNTNVLFARVATTAGTDGLAHFEKDDYEKFVEDRQRAILLGTLPNKLEEAITSATFSAFIAKLRQIELAQRKPSTASGNHNNGGFITATAIQHRLEAIDDNEGDFVIYIDNRSQQQQQQQPTGRQVGGQNQQQLFRRVSRPPTRAAAQQKGQISALRPQNLLTTKAPADFPSNVNTANNTTNKMQGVAVTSSNAANSSATKQPSASGYYSTVGLTSGDAIVMGQSIGVPVTSTGHHRTAAASVSATTPPFSNTTGRNSTLPQQQQQQQLQQQQQQLQQQQQQITQQSPSQQQNNSTVSHQNKAKVYNAFASSIPQSMSAIYPPFPPPSNILYNMSRGQVTSKISLPVIPVNGTNDLPVNSHIIITSSRNIPGNNHNSGTINNSKMFRNNNAEYSPTTANSQRPIMTSNAATIHHMLATGGANSVSNNSKSLHQPMKIVSVNLQQQVKVDNLSTYSAASSNH